MKKFRLATTMLALALAGAAAGCQKDTDERLGLSDKRSSQEFDPRSLDGAGELEKAVSASSAVVERKLGSHRLAQGLKLNVESGDRKEALEESWLLEVDGKGGAHLDHQTSHDQAFETYIVDGQIFVKPKYLKFVRRPAEGDDIERLRDEQQGVLAGYLQILGRFASRKELGAVTHLGRAAHKVELSLASSPSRLRDPDAAHAWRKTMKVSALTGQVVIDDASGAALHAELEAAYTATRAAPEAGAKAPADVHVRVSYRGDVSDVGSVPPIGAPAEYLPGIARARPLIERDELLEGLVPPRNRAAGAAPAARP